MLKIEEVAAIAHEANRRLKKIIGEPPLEAWEETPDDLKRSACGDVMHRLTNPSATDAEHHANRVKLKMEQGWKLGPVEDRARKIHPNLVSYEQLPPEQKVKAALFGSIVKALAPMTEKVREKAAP